MAAPHLSVRVHFVWSTRGRVPVLSPAWCQRLYSHLGSLAGQKGAALIAAGGMPDHIHLLVSLPENLAIRDLVDTLKTESAAWVRTTWLPRTNFAWQENYGAFGVSKSLEAKVIRYIQGQECYHRTMGFQSEFRSLLERHGIEYGEEGLWD